MGPQRKSTSENSNELPWNSCPYDSERPNTVRGSYEEQKKQTAPSLRPYEPDVERAKELTDMILFTIETGGEVDHRWVYELDDICRLHNRYGVPESRVCTGLDRNPYCAL